MISPYPISQIFYPPISHIPDFLPPISHIPDVCHPPPPPIQPCPTHILYQCAKCGDDRTSFSVICDVCDV